MISRTTKTRKKRMVRRASSQKNLAKLTVDESAQILDLLLRRHLDLLDEAEALAAEMIAAVDADRVADDIEQTIRLLDIAEMNARAGKQPWGYVEPTDAAWSILGKRRGEPTWTLQNLNG